MNETITTVLLPVTAAVISALGQLLLKHTMLRHGDIVFTGRGILQLLSEPLLIIAVFVYAGTLVLWLYVLSKVPLSTAYPMLAVTYVLVPLLSIWAFNEHIVQQQWIGMFLILMGVALVGSSKAF